MEACNSFTWIGIALILLGLALVALPLITKHFPSLETLPWILIWVYRKDGFLFATSPILILASIVSAIVTYILKYR